MRTEERSINVQAKNLDAALKNAAKNLGVETTEVGYEIISQTDAGLLSFLGGRKIEIKAWSTKRPERSERSERPQRERGERGNRRDSRRAYGAGNDEGRGRREARPEVPAEPAEPLTQKEVDDLVEDLRDFCKNICQYIAGGEEVEVATHLDGERLTLNIKNEYLADKILKNTRLAESLEHILRKKPRYLKRELPFRIFVDAEGQRASRETELVEMAKDLSLQVIEKQKPIVLNYKSSYDRKIIHMALDKNDQVYTKSIGTGANRKLMILPVRAGGESQDHDVYNELDA